MKQKTRLIFNTVVAILLLGLVGILSITKNEAHKLITAPQATRNLPEETPATYNLPYEDVTILPLTG